MLDCQSSAHLKMIWHNTFSVLTFAGPWGKNGDSKPKKFQQIWNQDPKIYVILRFEGPSSKNEKFQNFSNFLNFFEKIRGLKSKFWFHSVFSNGSKNTFWKFESSSSKTEGGVPILLKMTFFDLAAMTFDLSGFWKVVTQALLHSNNIS